MSIFNPYFDYDQAPEPSAEQFYAYHEFKSRTKKLHSALCEVNYLLTSVEGVLDRYEEITNEYTQEEIEEVMHDIHTTLEELRLAVNEAQDHL